MKALPEKVAVVVANLQQRGASKPRTVKTLSSTIASLFQKQLTETELNELLDALKAQGIVAVNGTKISYALPESDTNMVNNTTLRITGRGSVSPVM